MGIDEQIHQQIICANVFIRDGDRLLMLRRSRHKKYAPGIVHPVGGKVDPNENPFAAAEREVLEETGLSVRDMRLEAVLLDIQPVLDEPYNWLIYHFSADLAAGALRATEEGELVWMTRQEILGEKLHPSLQPIIGQILDHSVGTIFVTNEYDDLRERITRSSTHVCGAPA